MSGKKLLVTKGLGKESSLVSAQFLLPSWLCIILWVNMKSDRTNCCGSKARSANVSMNADGCVHRSILFQTLCIVHLCGPFRSGHSRRNGRKCFLTSRSRTRSRFGMQNTAFLQQLSS